MVSPTSTSAGANLKRLEATHPVVRKAVSDDGRSLRAAQCKTRPERQFQRNARSMHCRYYGSPAAVYLARDAAAALFDHLMTALVQAHDDSVADNYHHSLSLSSHSCRLMAHGVDTQPQQAEQEAYKQSKADSVQHQACDRYAHWDTTNTSQACGLPVSCVCLHNCVLSVLSDI